MLAALTALALATTQPGPATGGWAAIALALVIVLWAMWPEAHNRARESVQSAPASTEVSRRSFLKGAAVATAALLLGARTAVAEPPPPPRRCQDQYNLCYGCDPDENECCIECYVRCQLGPPCVPGLDCGGCWPGP